jgi:hypothetical protein
MYAGLLAGRDDRNPPAVKTTGWDSNMTPVSPWLTRPKVIEKWGIGQRKRCVERLKALLFAKGVLSKICLKRRE